MTRAIRYFPTTLGVVIFTWTYWTALVNTCHMLWASWWALVWLHVTGPVLLSVGLGSPMSLSGVLYNESPDSDFISSCFCGCAMCISKFLWTIQVHPSPCHGLIVCTGRLSCHSTTTYLVKKKNSISLEQNQFFQRTQAFASPTDMASSGVWENIVLSKTPTFDGVCGMLSFTIWIICQKII